MRKQKTFATFEPGRGYTQEDWASVDNPELADAELAGARPFADAFPELAASIRRTRGGQKLPVKVRVTLRLDKATVAAFKATGPGWQTRIGELVKKGVPSGPRAIEAPGFAGTAKMPGRR